MVRLKLEPENLVRFQMSVEPVVGSLYLLTQLRDLIGNSGHRFHDFLVLLRQFSDW